MKIAIADDEILIRVGIRSLVNWENYDCEIIWEASGGNETLVKMEEQVPDILFLDITMPGTDGLQVIKSVNGKYRDLSIIVISCHEEFSIVREALRSGAEDYLLKHALMKENLIQIVEEKKKRMDRTHGSAVTDSGEVERSRKIRSFLEEKNEDGIKELMGKDIPCITVYVMQIMGYETIKERYVQKGAGYLETMVIEIIGRLLCHIPDKLVIPAAPDNYVIIVGRKLKTDGFQQLEQGQRLANAMKKYLNLSVVLGISQVTEGDGQYLAALCQARVAVELAYFDTSATLFQWNPSDISEIRKRVSEQIEEMAASLKNLVKMRKEEEFAERLEQGINELIRGKEAGAYYVKSILLLVVKEIFSLSLAQVEELAEDIHRTKSITNVKDIFIKGYKMNTGGILSQYNPDNYLVKQAMEYLKEHYKEQITLNELSEYLHVSASYISRLFKTEADTNVIKYLNMIRIEKAKVLLRDHTLKPYQVADMVGFNNRVYFDNVFKSMVGTTPSDYRKSPR